MAQRSYTERKHNQEFRNLPMSSGFFYEDNTSFSHIFVTHPGLSKKSGRSFKVHLLKFNKKESLQILLCLLL